MTATTDDMANEQKTAAISKPGGALGMRCKGCHTMTVDDAISNMYEKCFEQSRQVAIAGAGFDNGRVSQVELLEECFLLAYDCAKLNLGLWPEVGADEAALVLVRHWHEFIDAIPSIKRRVLDHEGVEVKTSKQRMIIEARWREALDLVEERYDDGDFELRPKTLSDQFFDNMQSQSNDGRHDADE